MSLRIWLPLTGTLENKGISNYTITKANAVSLDQNGKIGKCATATSSATITITVPELETMFGTGSTYSLACWVKLVGTASNGWLCQIGSNSCGLWWAKSEARWVWNENDNGKRCYRNNIANDYSNWHHVVTTVDKTVSGKITYINYVDGAIDTQFPSYTFDKPSTVPSGTTITINPYIASINDIRIYDHILSAAEVKEISQGLVLHYKLDDITNGAQDSSGYGNKGIIVGSPTITSDTPRYSNSLTVNGSTSYFYYPHFVSSDQLLSECTFATWIKRTYTDATARYFFYGPIRVYLHTDFYTRITWEAQASDGTHTLNTWAPGNKTLISENTWTHIAFTLKDSVFTAYINGSKVGTNTRPPFIRGYQGTNGSIGYTFIGKISDTRFYVTALSDDDIKALYNIAAKVDNLGGLHTFELNENGSNKLTKSGIFKDYMVEPFITLDDGSKWQLLMFHYVDDGNNLFTSSNAGFNNGFGLYSRLNYIDNFKYNNKYEFYVIQDGIPHRWTQTNAPLTTTSVANFTVVSGSPGGGICKCNGNTLLARTNTTSNWWDACGCWTKYQTGIPGFNGVCNKYLALYARISEPKFHIANLSVYANNLIER